MMANFAPKEKQAQLKNRKSIRQKRRLADMDMSKPLNRSDRRAVSAMKRKGK
tara:strand:- start:760 stop:915 length:156 start_codon:yes stop_codon:yes gene_type:complete